MGLKDILKKNGLITDNSSSDDDSEDTSVDTDDTPAPTPLTVVKGNARGRRIVAAPLTASTPVTTPTVAPDQQIVTELQTAVARSTVKGYEEFRTLFDAMDGMPDAQRFTAALKALAAGQKISASQVLQSIDDRRALLDAQRAAFESAYENQVAQTVTKKQDDTNKAADRIKELRDEIQKLEGQRITLAQEAADAQVQLETERATFSASYEVVLAQLENERSRIAAVVTTKPEK